MSVPVNDNLGINSPKATDSRNMKFVSGASTPFASVSEAHAAITYKSAGVPIYIVVNGRTVEHQYVGGLALENLVVFNPPPNFYYDSNFFTGDITANSPLSISPTGVEGGTYTNPVVTVNNQGQVTAIEDGTGGGTITSFVTDTDIEITDYTKGIIQYSANGKKWRKTKNNDGTDLNSDLYGIDPTVFLANFTGTNGTDFNTYTPDTGKAHSTLAPVVLNGSGGAIFPNGAVSQIIIDEKIPPYRKYSMRVNSLAFTATNFFQFTILRNSDNSKYVYVVFFYVDSTHMGINILTENQSVPVALGTQFAITYPFTAHVDYLGGNKIAAYVNTNTGYVSGVVPDMTGLYDYADAVCLLGGNLDWLRLNYADYINPVVFYDTFTGGAGSWSGHTPDVGTATMTPTDSTFGPITLDGAGNGVFDPAKVSQLVVSGSLIPNRLTTALVVSFPANGSLFQTTVLRSGDGSQYRYVKISRVDATHVFFAISAESNVDLAIAASGNLAVTYPLALQVIFDGTTITASINNANVLTTTNLGSGLLQYGDFVGVNGVTVNSLKIENL